MKLTLLSPLIIVATVAILLCGWYFLLAPAAPVHAGAGDLPGTVATTSVSTFGTTAALAFATSTCGARVISTTASPIMITFSDNQGVVPSAQVGTLQAASTTVTYENKAFGCGTYRIYSFVSGPVTLMESR